MQPTATQGTDRNVKSIFQIFAAGLNQVILPAKQGTIYRVVGVQWSLDAAGSVEIYHGTASPAAGSPKVIAAAKVGATWASTMEKGDWASQTGAASNEVISADVVGANCYIVLDYIEISVQV